MEKTITVQSDEYELVQAFLRIVHQRGNTVVEQLLAKLNEEEEADYQYLAMLEAQRGMENEEAYSLDDAQEIIS